MVAAMVMTRKNPNSQQLPMLMIMPYGTAFVAFAASSLICTQLSNDPIVQIGLSQLNINAHPVGHVVKFSVRPKIYPMEFLALAFPTGSAMIVATMRAKFMTTKTVCSLPMTRDRVEASTPWQSTAPRKTR